MPHGDDDRDFGRLGVDEDDQMEGHHMSTAVARKIETKIARPVKVLVPLIAIELSDGDRAGLEHYRRAGDMLLEAREQVAPFKWGQWLSKNFALSRATAGRYMQLAEIAERRGPQFLHKKGTIEEALGYRTAYERRNEPQNRPIREFIADLDVDEFAVKKQQTDRLEEIRLHRELAEQMIEIGFKALATRLHSDHGGSDVAMRRLNRVRRELKAVAQTRRFE